MSGVPMEQLADLQKKSVKMLSKSMLFQMEPQDAIQLLATGAMDETFNSQEQAVIGNSLATDIRQRSDEAARQLKVEQDKVMSKLSVGINKGEIKETDIESLHKDGTLDDSQYLKLIKEFNGNVEKKAKRAAGIAQIGRLKDAKTGIDPSNKDMMASVDAYYEDVLAPSIAGMNAEEATNSIISFISDIGAIPTKTKEIIAVGLNSPNPVEALSSAQMLMGLREMDIRSVNEAFSKDQIAFADNFTKYSALGNPQRAYDLSEKRVYGSDTPEYKARNKEFNDLVDTDLGYDEVTKDMSLISSYEDLPQAVKDVYVRELRANYVDYNMSEKTAKEEALKSVRNIYGEFDTGNGVMEAMAFPPSRYYHIEGVDDVWMSAQLRNDITAKLGRSLKDT